MYAYEGSRSPHAIIKDKYILKIFNVKGKYGKMK
jgi:hypothetical protein